MSGLLVWFFALAYPLVTLSVWLVGASRFGTRIEQMKDDALGKAIKELGTWTSKNAWTFHARDALFTSEAAFIGRVLALGLFWPLLIPLYLSFNRGKASGLSQRATQAALNVANAEIRRITKAEGWTK